MSTPIRLLVVDDFTDFRQWIRSKLKTNHLFFIAGEAANAGEAIQKARELTPDLILLDLNLPDMNGLEVQQELLRMVPSAKVLFLSGCGDEDIVDQALSKGAGGYLLNTDANQELVSAMEVVALGKTFVSNRLKEARARAFSPSFRLALSLAISLTTAAEASLKPSAS